MARPAMVKKPKRKPTGAAAMGPGPGRPKGCPNKMTTEIKGAIEAAFTGLGGAKALTAWAKENQEAFYTKVWIKLLPSKIEGDLALRLEDLVTGKVRGQK